MTCCRPPAWSWRCWARRRRGRAACWATAAWACTPRAPSAATGRRCSKTRAGRSPCGTSCTCSSFPVHLPFSGTALPLQSPLSSVTSSLCHSLIMTLRRQTSLPSPGPYSSLITLPNLTNEQERAVCGHWGHTGECILLICVTEETLSKYRPSAGLLGWAVSPEAEKAECGGEWIQRMCLLKSEHFKNDEGNKSVLDVLIASEIVRAGWNLGQHEVMSPNQVAVIPQFSKSPCVKKSPADSWAHLETFRTPVPGWTPGACLFTSIGGLAAEFGALHLEESLLQHSRQVFTPLTPWGSQFQYWTSQQPSL